MGSAFAAEVRSRRPSASLTGLCRSLGSCRVRYDTSAMEPSHEKATIGVGPDDRPASELADLAGDLIRLKGRLRVVLPDDIARLKERLGELHGPDARARETDYDLFYRVAVVLHRRREPVTMGDLATALAVPLSTATRMVDWLVEAGYAERLADPLDRRVVLVGLTESGRTLYATISVFLVERVAALTRGLTPDERATLVTLLRKVLAAVDAAAP